LKKKIKINGKKRKVGKKKESNFGKKKEKINEKKGKCKKKKKRNALWINIVINSEVKL